MLIDSEELKAWAREWIAKTSCCKDAQASYEHMLTKIAELEQKQKQCVHVFHSVCYYNCGQPRCGHTSKDVCEKCDYDPSKIGKA